MGQTEEYEKALDYFSRRFIGSHLRIRNIIWRTNQVGI